MKIQPPSDSRVNSTASNGVERRNGASKPAASGAGATSGASVTLSELSTRLKSGAGQVNGAEFDQAKVESIKQAISDGKLKVNPEVIADKLIANAIALTGKKQG